MKQGKGVYFNAIINANKLNKYLISNYLNGRAASSYISTLGLLVSCSAHVRHGGAWLLHKLPNKVRTL
jgi:hypothetical protein